MPQCTYSIMKKRQKLVDLVINHGMTIARAARKLFIKSSTAKRIVKIFRINGTFSLKKPGTLLKDQFNS